MKKFLAILLLACMLVPFAAMADEAAEAPIQLGQVAMFVHGKGFAVVSAVVQGETILQARIDEFQFMGDREDVAAVPVAEGIDSFAVTDENGNVTSVLGSKRVNNDLYSLNMQRAGSTTQIAANYIIIEDYVQGKTISELEAETADKEAADYVGTAVDAVSSATLADTLNYVKAVIAAAKNASVQEGLYAIYNKTGETVTELFLVDNVTGERSINYAVNGLANDAMMTITTAIDGTESAHGRLTIAYKTESGRAASFATLSIEKAPITLLAEDAMTGATPLNFFKPAE